LLRAAYGAMREVYRMLDSAPAPVVADEHISSVREVHDAVGTEALLAFEAQIEQSARSTPEPVVRAGLLEAAAPIPMSDLAL